MVRARQWLVSCCDEFPAQLENKDPFFAREERWHRVTPVKEPGNTALGLLPFTVPYSISL